MSITLAVAAGISCMAHPHYRKILKICLDVIGEFPKKGVPKPIQLHFYEFYILVMNSINFYKTENAKALIFLV